MRKPSVRKNKKETDVSYEKIVTEIDPKTGLTITYMVNYHEIPLIHQRSIPINRPINKPNGNSGLFRPLFGPVNEVNLDDIKQLQTVLTNNERSSPVPVDTIKQHDNNSMRTEYHSRDNYACIDGVYIRRNDQVDMNRVCKDIDQICKERGGQCLNINEAYVNNKSKIKFRCGCCKNEWEATFSNVKNHKSWCTKCTTGISERKCGAIIQRITGYEFKKCRPVWLKGDKNKSLELDLYNDSLQLALEYNGIQHYKEVNFGTEKITSDLEEEDSGDEDEEEETEYTEGKSEQNTKYTLEEETKYNVEKTKNNPEEETKNNLEDYTEKKSNEDIKKIVKKSKLETQQQRDTLKQLGCDKEGVELIIVSYTDMKKSLPELKQQIYRSYIAYMNKIGDDVIINDMKDDKELQDWLKSDAELEGIYNKRSRDNKQFVLNYIKNRNLGYTFVDENVQINSNTTKFKLRCPEKHITKINIDDNIFTTCIDNLVHTHGGRDCPTCSKHFPWDKQKVIDYITLNDSNIEVLDFEYTSTSKTKIPIRCKECGMERTPTLDNIKRSINGPEGKSINGPRKKICSHRNRKKKV